MGSVRIRRRRQSVSRQHAFAFSVGCVSGSRSRLHHHALSNACPALIACTASIPTSVALTPLSQKEHHSARLRFFPPREPIVPSSPRSSAALENCSPLGAHLWPASRFGFPPRWLFP